MLPQTTILTTLTSLLLLASPATARTWAGGVDMNQACKWQHGDSYYTFAQANNPSNPGWSSSSWRCTCSSCPIKSVDVGAYCRRKYGGTAYADPQGGGLYDWGCDFP